jgi:hypothetical protein
MEYEIDEDVPVSPPRSTYSLILVEIVQEQQEEEQQPEELQPEELQPQEQQPMVVMEDMEDTKPTSIRKEFSHEPCFNFDFN